METWNTNSIGLTWCEFHCSKRFDKSFDKALKKADQQGVIIETRIAYSEPEVNTRYQLFSSPSPSGKSPFQDWEWISTIMFQEKE